MKKLTAIVNGKIIKGIEYDRMEDNSFVWIETEEDIHKVKATNIVGTKKEIIERIGKAIHGMKPIEYMTGAMKAGLSCHYASCLGMYSTDERYKGHLEKNYSKTVLWKALKSLEGEYLA